MFIRQYIQIDSKLAELVIRPYTPNDFEQLIDIQRECFPPPFPEELLWNREQLTEHVQRFPQGAICAELNGRLIGSMTTLLTSYQQGDLHPWSEVTDDGYIRTHNPQGNTLYVVDISVRPSHRSLGVGKLLMQAMYYLVIHLKVERLLGGGRMPGYRHWKDKLTPEEYAHKVVQGELHDPVISFLLRCGRIPYGVVHNYLEDEESGDCGLLMAWENPMLDRSLA